MVDARALLRATKAKAGAQTEPRKHERAVNNNGRQADPDPRSKNSTTSPASSSPPPPSAKDTTAQLPSSERDNDSIELPGNKRKLSVTGQDDNEPDLEGPPRSTKRTRTSSPSTSVPEFVAPPAQPPPPPPPPPQDFSAELAAFERDVLAAPPAPAPSDYLRSAGATITAEPHLDGQPAQQEEEDPEAEEARAAAQRIRDERLETYERDEEELRVQAEGRQRVQALRDRLAAIRKRRA